MTDEEKQVLAQAREKAKFFEADFSSLATSVRAPDHSPNEMLQDWLSVQPQHVRSIIISAAKAEMKPQS